MSDLIDIDIALYFMYPLITYSNDLGMILCDSCALHCVMALSTVSYISVLYCVVFIF